MIGKSFRRTGQRFDLMRNAYDEYESAAAAANDAYDEEDILNRPTGTVASAYVPPLPPSRYALSGSSSSSSYSRGNSISPEEWKVYEENPHLQAQTNSRSNLTGSYSHRQLQQQHLRHTNGDSARNLKLSTNSQLRMSTHSDSNPHQKSIIQSIGNNINAAWTSVIEVVNRNFASSTAVRDFNETMPVVLPSGFVPTKGVTLESNPQQRMSNL